MNKSRGSGRPACEEAAADAGYASGTWRRAASLSGQAGAGGRTDVELLMHHTTQETCSEKVVLEEVHLGVHLRADLGQHLEPS